MKARSELRPVQHLEVNGPRPGHWLFSCPQVPIVSTDWLYYRYVSRPSKPAVSILRMHSTCISWSKWRSLSGFGRSQILLLPPKHYWRLHRKLCLFDSFRIEQPHHSCGTWGRVFISSTGWCALTCDHRICAMRHWHLAMIALTIIINSFADFTRLWVGCFTTVVTTLALACIKRSISRCHSVYIWWSLENSTFNMNEN